MAIQSRVLGSLLDETNGGTATLRVEYDDALLRLTLIEVVNGTTLPVAFTARRTSGSGQTYTRTVAAGVTDSVSVPGNAQNRLGITIDSRGRIDGVEWNFGFA